MVNVELLSKEMESFYTQYIDAFNGEDLTALARLFSFPSGSIGGKRGMIVFEDQAAFVSAMGKSKAALRSRGWTRTGIDTVRAWPTADDMGMLIADFSRYREDGSILESGRACYTLRRDDGAWKIITLMGVANRYLGPGNVPR